MTDVTIESIAIEITASADEADKALQRLSQSLATLKSAVSGGLEGTSKVAKSLKELAEGAKSFEGVNADKIRSVAEALNSLKNIGQIPDLSNLAKAVKDISSAANSINGADMSTFAANMQSFVAAIQPLSSLQGMGDFSSAINALNKLPKVAQNLQGVNLGTFAQQMQQITAAIQPFATQMQSLSTTFNGLPAPVQQAVTSLSNYGTAANNASENTSRLGKSLKLLNFTAMYFAIKKVVSVLGTFVNTSNEYVENLNLFNVTMGEGAEEALNFANRVNELMGIDVSQWIQNQGVFNQMASGFGIVGEKANLLSKNLTQLGYDISSYYNISVESAMEKLQSAMAGQVMPLRSLGYAIDEATLKQVALNHGITESVTNMSQAQKAQLRYIAIMEQSKNAMGDMARTIDSPANQLRILESRIETLKRAIGDSLMPVISAALPYVTAFVKLLGEGFRALAELLGFKVPEFDYSDLMQKSNEGIAESFDEATAASKRFKGTLASIDQLNIIGSNKETSGAGDFAGFDLDLELPSYDFLGNLKEETDKAYETLKKFWENVKPILESVAAGIAAAFVINKVSDVITGVKNIADAFKSLNGSVTGKFVSSIVAAVAAFTGFRKIVKDLTVGKSSFSSLAVGIGAVAAAVGVFLAVGNPLGAILTVVGAIAGAVVGWVQGQKELNQQLADSITYADNGGIAIRDLTNGFSGYFDEISSHYSDILENTRAFEDNEAKINSAAGEIKNLTDKYIALGGEMTTEDAEKLKSNLEIIADGVTESLGIGTQGIVEALKGTFHDFATSLGYDVDEMVGKFYLLESMGNEAVASVKKNADALVGKIMAGEDVAENMAKLNEEIAKMGTADIGTKEQFSFNEAIQNMASGNINLGSPEEAKAAIEDLQARADAAKASIDEAQTAQLYELETLKNRYSSMVTESGRTVKEEYDALNGEGAFDELIAQTREGMLAGFEADKARIDTGVDVYVAMVKEQLEKSADKYAKAQFSEKGPKAGSVWKNFFSNGGLLASGEDLYDVGLEDYKAEYRKMNSELYDIVQTSSLSEADGEKIMGYFMTGMQNGAINGQDDLNKALDAIATGGLSELEKVFDINSPSKKTAEIGGYLMSGLTLGITSGKSKVLSALDDVANAMIKKMEGLEFAVPVYSEEDVNRMYSGTLGGFYGAQTMPTAEHRGVDSQAIGEAGRALADNGTPINVDVKVQSYVELDGEQIGQSVSNYQQRQLAYSNGR